MNNTARMRTATIAREMWLSIFPHIEIDGRPFNRAPSKFPAEEYRLTVVKPGTHVAADDLLLVVPQHPQYSRAAERFTAREALRERGAYVVRAVSAATAKTVRVQDVIKVPNGGNWRMDLTELGHAIKGYPETRRLSLNATSYDVYRLGGRNELLAKLQQHPDYAEWETLRAAGQVEEEAEKAAREAKDEEVEARQRPFREAVEALNKLTGETLATWEHSYTDYGYPAFVTPWLAEGNHIRTYLSGLIEDGKLTNGQYHDAIKHADTILSAYTQEK